MSKEFMGDNDYKVQSVSIFSPPLNDLFLNDLSFN